MENFKEAKVKYTINNNTLEVNFSGFKEKFVWKEVKVTLCYWALVKEENPKDDYQEIETKKFVIDSNNTISFFNLDNSKITYKWKNIEVVYFLKIKINDKLIFKDTQGIFILKKDWEFSYKKFSFQNSVERFLLDKMEYKKAFWVLNPFFKILMIFIWFYYIFLIVWMLPFIYNTFPIFKDYWLPVLDFFHGIVVAFVGLFVSIVLSYLILLLFAKGLNYEIDYENIEKYLKAWRIDWLINWKILHNMKNVSIWIAVSNQELWRHYVYERTSKWWKTKRIRNFEYYISCFNLFKKDFDLLSKWEDLSYYIKWVINSKEFFKNIWPNIYFDEYDSRYWLKTKIELTITSPEYKDIHKAIVININKSLFSTNLKEITKDFENREELYI